MCEIYDSRPDHCEGYPWNFANDIFPECIFYDAKHNMLNTMEEQLEINTEAEINEYCCRCGKCCCYWEKIVCLRFRIKSKILAKCLYKDY